MKLLFKGQKRAKFILVEVPAASTKFFEGKKKKFGNQGAIPDQDARNP